MFRSVLVPVDGSFFAEHALPYARAALAPDGTLHLVLVHQPPGMRLARPVPRDAVADVEDAMRRAERRYLDELRRRETDAGPDVVVHIGDGAVAEALAAYAADHDIDLVVMTTHGHGGFQRMWLGSVADALVRHLHVPILLIRPHPMPRPSESDAPRFTNVLVATDGSEPAGRALAAALRLVPPTNGARFTLLTVVQPPAGPQSAYLPHAAELNREALERRRTEAEAQLAGQAAALRRQGLAVEQATVVDHRVAHAILGRAAAMQADLVVLGTRGLGTLPRLFVGSVADKVIRGAEMPVLVAAHASPRPAAV
jgi:nucleotide-binding universal stress UspA family protein